MKLIIQIPCYNEEKTLPVTLADIPRKIEGIDNLEVLIIDDGSTDRTAEVARECGAEHIVRLKKRMGLAEAFSEGLNFALSCGADIIVNTDADNQYKGDDIAGLIKPILEERADMVVGCRDMGRIKHFSFIKKKLQKAGSLVVRHLSGINIPDATSGFRAYSKKAAAKLNVISKFTYTLETLIQAGRKGICVEKITIDTNPDLRPSRLYSSTIEYLAKSAATIIRIYALYNPLKTFLYLGGLFFFSGFGLSLRFLYFYFAGRGAGHVQSLILSAVLMIIGFQTGLIGLLADLAATNRALIEETLEKIKKSEISHEVWDDEDQVNAQRL